METILEDKKKAYKNVYAKKYREEHKEAIKIKQKKYREDHKEAKRFYDKNYIIENSEHIKQRSAHYRVKNAENIKIKDKKRYLKNIKTRKTKSREYYEKHKEIRKIYSREYQRNRRKNDPIFKIICKLRKRIGEVLKFQGAKKSIKILDGIGCTPEFLRNYLEYQFREGMSWDNHSLKGWHIDHIKPCSSFDLNNPEEQKMVNHYTNLQPLWWWENLQKSDKCDTFKADEKPI